MNFLKFFATLVLECSNTVLLIVIKLFGVGRSHPLPKSRLAPSPGSIAWLPSLTRSPNAAATAHGQLRRTTPRSSTIFKHSEVNPPNAQHQSFSSQAGTTPPKRSSNNTHSAEEGQPYAGAAATQGGVEPPLPLPPRRPKNLTFGQIKF